MTTLNLQVAASSDDAREAATTVVTLTGTSIAMSAGTIWAGLRFLNVTIPPGSTINTAVIQLNVVDTSNDDPNFDIYGNDVDDATTFLAVNGDISGRARTTAKTTWTATGVGAGFVASPSIVTVIQEIVDRAGWASGNDIAIILDGLAAAAFQFVTFDSAAGNAAKLDIDYTAPAAGSILRQMMAQHGL